MEQVSVQLDAYFMGTQSIDIMAQRWTPALTSESFKYSRGTCRIQDEHHMAIGFPAMAVCDVERD